MAGFLDKLSLYYVIFRTVISWIWLLINDWMWKDRFYRRRNVKRKILIIGDEFASGFGDWVTCGITPGYGKYLDAEIKAKEDVRFEWRAFSEGHPYSTSEEWLPDYKGKPASLGFLCWKKNLFAASFGEGALHADCDCVVIHLGYNDKTPDPEATAQNVMQIARALLEQGKRVWICTMPTRGYLEVGRVRRGWLLDERNQLLRKAVASAGEEHVHLGPDIEQYKRNELFCFDSKHLASKGYKRIAKELYTIIKNSLINIEWLFFQPGLQKRLAERETAIAEAMSRQDVQAKVAAALRDEK
ncbi:hypothetical protein DIPPA_08533 [Diplonema papillatum]|nr:hypothetical protein DIPPA_08533 [Diplonema papillatum]|eukprot:gene12596-19511_t